MTNLVTAYQNNDINDFEKILKQHRQTIMEDTFIREHIEDLLKNIRTQVSSFFFTGLQSCWKKSIIPLLWPNDGRIHYEKLFAWLNIDSCIIYC